MREEKMAASMDAYFEAMAIRASLGDIFAMQKLGDWFRAKLSEEYLTLENEWENAPDCKEKEFLESMSAHKEENFYARAGIMWYIRAFLYGNEQTLSFLENHRKLMSISLISVNFFNPGIYESFYFTGEELRKAGFLNIKENEKFSIKFLAGEGTFAAESDGGYESAGSDGFGMEEEYNFYRYDEFFNNIGKLWGYSNQDYRNNERRFLEECSAKKEIICKNIENFWKRDVLPQGACKYKWLLSERKTPVIIGNTLIAYCGEDKEYVVPSNIEIIKQKAFSKNPVLEKIMIPENVIKIEDFILTDCKRLKEVVFPDHLEMLGTGICTDSKLLETVHLPENLLQIPGDMFFGTEGLKHIHLPQNLKTINRQAFAKSGLENIDFPEGLEIIDKYAFAESHIRSAYIPANTRLERGAFIYCEDLTEVIIEDGITEIPEQCFFHCKKLRSIRLPKTLKEISSDAFTGDSSLENIFIPESAKDKIDSVFANRIIIYEKGKSEIIIHDGL